MMEGEQINEYGDEAEIRLIRRKIIHEGELMSIIRGKWKLQKIQSVMMLRAVSEVLGLIACDKDLIPLMVSNVRETYLKKYRDLLDI